MPTDKTGNSDCHSTASLLRCKKSFSPFDGMRFNKRFAFYAFQKGQKAPAHSIQANGTVRSAGGFLCYAVGPEIMQPDTAAVRIQVDAVKVPV